MFRNLAFRLIEVWLDINNINIMSYVIGSIEQAQFGCLLTHA